MHKKRLFISFIFSIVVSGIIFYTLNDFGITWDEPIHFSNAGKYIKWLKNPTIQSIGDTFRVVDDEDVHPPLRKLIAGITHEILTTELHVIDNTRGYRISALFFIIPFILLFTYVSINQFGFFIGILVAFMYSFLPHVLFLTSLVTMDYAVAALWFMSVICAMKGMKNRVWLTISAVLVGLTLLTKLHGFLLFGPIIVYWMFYYQKVLFGKTTFRLRLPILKTLIYFIFTSFAVYVVFWPWLWTSPIMKIKEYFLIQFAHQGIPVYIFDKIYQNAPWWYTPVMFLTTTPVFVLLLFFVGLIFVIRKGTSWDRCMLFNALYPMAFFSLPGVYRYDGVRLFLASFPFVCLIAGRGIFILVRSLQSSRRYMFFSLLGIFWILTVYTSVVRIHPWESSYYNELIGGISGAWRRGFETEYWGNAYLGVLPWMNARTKDMMCVFPTPQPFYYYQAMGQLDARVVFNAERSDCRYLVVLMRQGLFIRDPQVARIVATQESVFAFRLDGVDLVSIYDIGSNK